MSLANGNPHFPALRSDPSAVSGASRQKQIPSSHSAEVNAAATLLTLHHDAAKTSGIHLSLKPIRADRRALVAKAVIGRIGGV